MFFDVTLSLSSFSLVSILRTRSFTQGNWTYSAGVGADPREDRYFHPIKQGTRYDKNGDYMRYWLKEISSDVPAHALINPWKHGIHVKDDVTTTSGISAEEDSKRVRDRVSCYPSRPIVNMMGFEWKPKNLKKNDVEKHGSKKKRRNNRRNGKKSRVQHF